MNETPESSLAKSKLIWRVGKQQGVRTPGVAEVLLSDTNEVLGARLLDVGEADFGARTESDELAVESHGRDLTVAVDGRPSESEFIECTMVSDATNQLVGFELELPIREPQVSISRVLPRVLLGE